MIFHVLPLIWNRQAYYQHIPPWINRIFPEYQVQEAGETNKCSKHFLSSTLFERSTLRVKIHVGKMDWQNRLSGPSEENRKYHLVHIVDRITGYKDKEILDKGTMIAHTLRKAIRGEKMQFPRIKENFADMEFKRCAAGWTDDRPP